MTGEIRVLHVDDDPAFLEVVDEFLGRREASFDVVTATDAEEGLERIARDCPDCVVSDYEMPGTDGLEFLEAVREEHPDLPFVLFTGKGSEEIASEAISAGATEYLQKGGGTDQYDLLANRVRNAAERYRTERTLRRERSRMEFALESTDAAVWTRDTDTDGMELLPEDCPVFDTSIGSFPEFLRQVHPDDRDDVESAARAAADAVEPYSVEFRYFDDGIRWAEMYGRTIEDGGEPSLQTGITHDITDRREHRRRFETLSDTLPGIVYRCRVAPDWPMEDVRGDVESFVGYTAEQLEAGEVVWGEEVLHPEDRERAMAVVEESLADGESFELTYRVLTEDGETRWAYECGRGVETPEEERDVLEGFITDVTDRKRRERELQRSKRRFESMFEDPNILLGLIDTDGTLLDVNETALEYVDADRREVIGEPFPETPWWDEGDTSDLRRRLDRAADGEYVPYENAHSGPDGTVFVEGTLRPVTDDDGEVTSLIASTRDVTERVRRERRLERQNERFDELADVVSHDLATPITTVKGRLELAAETGDVEHVEAARSALERVDDLREGLVDTLRGRAIVRDTDPVAVGELARAAWKGVADDGAELRIVDPPEVEGDADAVRRLLQNLLSNSVEHGGTGVTVRVGAVEEGFYVADDGSGIPEADREDVFTPGFSTKEGGTGMGMASVSQIVDAHGWEIDLEESDPGGARFVIRTRG